MMHFFRNRADRSSIFVERINNVAGSTAGAGSADYYAYRNRRRDAIAKANWDEKMDAIEHAQEEFEENKLEERIMLEIKKDKKKEKRKKKKANKEVAKAAKTLNKFENNGDFLNKYLQKTPQGEEGTLGKREQHEESEDEGDSEENESVEPKKEVNIHGKQENSGEKRQKEAVTSSKQPKNELGESPHKVKVVEPKEKQT